MLAEYRLGALAVVENVFDNDWINRRLKQIDPNLFVEKQLTFAGEEVWCVVEDTGEQHGAERFICVYEFRGPDGKPIPYLTERIVEVIQQRAKTAANDPRHRSENVVAARQIAQRRADERRQKMREETDGQYRDIATDFERHRVIGNFAVVPRSPQLAITRRRVRAETAEQQRALDQARRIAREFRRG